MQDACVRDLMIGGTTLWSHDDAADASRAHGRPDAMIRAASGKAVHTARSRIRIPRPLTTPHAALTGLRNTSAMVDATMPEPRFSQT